MTLQQGSFAVTSESELGSREAVRQPAVDRDDFNLGTIVGVVLAVVVVLSIVWFFFLGGLNTGATLPGQQRNQVTVEHPVERQIGQPGF